MPNKIAHFKLKQIKIFLKTLLVLVCLDESEPLGLVLVRLGNIGISWKVDCQGVSYIQLGFDWTGLDWIGLDWFRLDRFPLG